VDLIERGSIKPHFGRIALSAMGSFRRVPGGDGSITWHTQGERGACPREKRRAWRERSGGGTLRPERRRKGRWAGWWFLRRRRFRRGRERFVSREKERNGSLEGVFV